MKLSKRIPFLLAGLQLLSLRLCDKLEDKDSGDFEEKLTKEGITNTLTSAYDELSDLTDQLQDALDDTIVKAEEIVKSPDEYLPPKKKDEYIPPKKKNKYVPPKNKDKYIPPKKKNKYTPPKKNDKYIPPKIKDEYIPPKKKDKYVPTKIKDEYIPPKKKDKYVPPKIKDEYIPPKKKDKYPNFPKKKDEYIPPNIRDEYDELSDLQDQLEEALDETLKEVEKRVKGQDEYIPPKKVEYPPKKRVKEKERPYLTPTRRPITGDKPPELESSYGLPPPPPGYDKYLQKLNNTEDALYSIKPSPVKEGVFVATYTVPPGAPLPDNHVLVPPELLSFPADSLYATPLEEEDEDDVEDFSEDVIIVDPRDQIEYNTQKPRGPKEVVESERQEEAPTNTVIDILKYIPLFIVTTIAMAASIVIGNIVG